MITIYGEGDDGICVWHGSYAGGDAYFADDEGRWEADLAEPGADAQMRISFWLAGNGTWRAGIGQVDPDVPLPDWGNGVGQHENGYSAELRIDAPESARLVNIMPTPKEPS